MIEFHPRIVELLNQPVVSTFAAVDLHDYYITTFYRNLQIGNNLYLASELLTSIEEPKMDSSVDRSLYNIKFSDPTNKLADKLNQGLVSKMAEIKLLFVDFFTNAPETNYYIIMYRGVIEGVSTEISLDNRIVIVSCASMLLSISNSNPFYTSKQFIRNIREDDTSFDQIYKGSKSISLKWGKSK
jgi:hypothetical protein